MSQPAATTVDPRPRRHPSPIRAPRPRSAVAGSPEQVACARALGLTYRVMLPRLSRAVSGPAGMAPGPLGRLCARDTGFYVSVARELGVWWEDLVADIAEGAESPEWRRIERAHMEDAAAELISAVRGLPAPVREVAERRASGMTWPQLLESLPGRVAWSVTDDWRLGLGLVWARAGDAVRRMA